VMAVSREALSLHLDYARWASGKLVDFAATVPAEDLRRDFGTADKNILGTLVHVFAADRLWLALVRGEQRSSFIDPADHDLAVLQNDWPGIMAGWREWLGNQSEETLKNPLGYRDLKGNPYQNPPWMIILHVVNHGTHHRGQVSGFLRAMGQNPPKTDLLFYYRENPC
jgi:uncharacterized damage-inducible protein DinB